MVDQFLQFARIFWRKFLISGYHLRTDSVELTFFVKPQESLGLPLREHHFENVWVGSGMCVYGNLLFIVDAKLWLFCNSWQCEDMLLCCWPISTQCCRSNVDMHSVLPPAIFIASTMPGQWCCLQLPLNHRQSHSALWFLLSVNIIFLSPFTTFISTDNSTYSRCLASFDLLTLENAAPSMLFIHQCFV